MKQLFNVVLFLLLFVLCGCSKEQSSASAMDDGRRVHEVLTTAEQLATDHPDSALSMIWRLNVDGMERTASFDDEQWQHITDKNDAALFGLLYTEVIHKKGLTMHEDTLIAQSLRHYTMTREPRRLCKALTHRGISLIDNGHLEEAVDVLKQAETMARKLGVDTLGYDVSMALGRLNQSAGCNGGRNGQ